MMENEKIYYREYRVYKPNKFKLEQGAASRIQAVKYFNAKDRERCVIFIDTAKQTGNDGENASFGWKDNNSKITVQLDDNDLGEFLQVLTGQKEGLGQFDQQKNVYKGLFHKSSKGNTVIKLDHSPEKGYIYSVSSQKDGQTVRISHYFTFGEAAILLEIIRGYIHMKYCN